MNNKYIGQPCTSCRSVIKEDEDIVVCPVCGSPYHRDCYVAEGKCVREDLHASGKSWTPEKIQVHVYRELGEEGAESAETASENTKRICKICGYENSGDSVFCTRCGTPVNMEKATGDRAQSFPPFIAFRNPAESDEDVDGNSISDYTRYIGSNFLYYLPKFLRFGKNGPKSSFNFWAFFFPNFYFIFRKMYGIGIAALILTAAMSIPGTLITLAQYGYITAAWALSDNFILLNNVLALLSYVISFVCGIFGNWFYYKKAKKDVEKIKDQYEGVADRNQALNIKGGTSLMALGFAFLCELAFTIIIIWAITPLMG